MSYDELDERYERMQKLIDSIERNQKLNRLRRKHQEKGKDFFTATDLAEREINGLPVSDPVEAVPVVKRVVTKPEFERMSLLQKSRLYEEDPETYHRLLGR